jgi:hypothetical protein
MTLEQVIKDTNDSIARCKRISEEMKNRELSADEKEHIVFLEGKLEALHETLYMIKQIKA